MREIAYPNPVYATLQCEKVVHLGKNGLKFVAFKCNICGEEIMDMKQLKVLAGRYRELRNAKEVVFSKWGNSIAIRVPNEIVNEYKLKPGRHGIMKREKKGITIIPT